MLAMISTAEITDGSVDDQRLLLKATKTPSRRKSKIGAKYRESWQSGSKISSGCRQNFAAKYRCLPGKIGLCLLGAGILAGYDSFLLAFSRSTKRRGVPKVVVTDNGTNFVAVDKELRETVAVFDRSRISRKLASNDILWKVNPRGVPNFGGDFKVMIHSGERAMHSTLSKADVTNEELYTAFVAAEGLINSRPLTTVKNRCPRPLTPQDFLWGTVFHHCWLNGWPMTKTTDATRPAFELCSG